MASSDTTDTAIIIIELGHNSSELAEQSADRSISMSRYQQLLQDTKKVDCPLLARLGYPIIVVSTTAGRKCIPQAQVAAVVVPRNNWMATVAVGRISTGLALGCVVGNVYALRTDGKDLTSKEWLILFKHLRRLKSDYGYPGKVDDALLSQYKADVRTQMRQQGLLRSGPTGSGIHCWGCGVEASDENSLRKCSACNNAR